MSSIVHKVKDVLAKAEAKVAESKHSSSSVNPAEPRTDTHATGAPVASHEGYSSSDNYALGGDRWGTHSTDLKDKLDPSVDTHSGTQGTATTGSTVIGGAQHHHDTHGTH